ncbi:SAM-dependent methyltransferase [Halobacteriales archaeon QS_4_69_34]|nr:MAG: SAM-dependent methyltransferase [Halobacteriales archaeon QS_4_69_34]
MTANGRERAGAVVLVGEDGDREYLREPGDRLETDLGVLDVPSAVEPGDVLETHLGERFAVRELRGPDLFAHFERTGAPMLPRDVGLVVGHTGLAAGDRVLDAGTGTGVLAASLGRLGASVLTYERDPEFAAIARENVALAGVAADPDGSDGGDRDRRGDRSGGHDGDEGRGDDESGGTDGSDDASADPGVGSVVVRTGNVLDDLDGLAGETFDVVTLDTRDAPAVAACAPDLLAPGGFLAAYVPFVEGTRRVVEAARAAGLGEVRTYETLQREMDFDERGSRPSTTGVGHTGYLVFARA